ncbi:hypothetical protein [Acinetobacter baumannii]|uniref:hypothetical protein n=1 Tax=Acinetobacter baumannii TaxID=470 RepID=UPI00244A6A50|nr:hypothetical protein [Acinetobacter baumannii]MDH2662925.1 hypothetical protein [Acinetobacter baumannii]
MDKCREEFEEYFKEHHADSFYSVDVALEMRGDDYIDFLASDLWAIWQHQQAKVEEANAKAQMCRDEKNHAINRWSAVCKERDELQKRVDAVKGLAQTLWEKSNEKHTQGKVWESKALGECADEILDVIEQALKGECRHESDGTNRLSLPPKTKCKKCGKFYSANVLKGEG